MNPYEVVHFQIIGQGIALLTINLVGLGTAVWFEHDNDTILSQSHYSFAARSW